MVNNEEHCTYISLYCDFFLPNLVKTYVIVYITYKITLIYVFYFAPTIRRNTRKVIVTLANFVTQRLEKKDRFE